MTIRLNRRDILGGLLIGALSSLPACRTSRDGFDAEVIILGAGLSGLYAANLLAAEGKDVLVLEGTDRIGGRLHTVEHGTLGYTEGGGEQIGASYARIIDMARQLNVELIPDRPNRRQTAYYYGDKLLSPKAWADFDQHPFEGALKGQSPGSPLFRLAGASNPLSTAEDWRAPEFANFDMSADDFLTSKGLGTEARRVVEVALNGNDLKSYSMMNLYRSLQLYTQSRGMGASRSVKGGAQRLPEAMAAALPHPVRLNNMIKSIEMFDDKVEVFTESGQTFKAPHCICTLPFGALRHLGLNMPLSEPQRAVIDGMPYTQIFQLHFKANTPFWEKDGLPLDMWTDTPVERIFARLNDNDQPTGLFRAWINGTATKQWVNNSEISEKAKALMKLIRPASDGDIEILKTQNWTKDNKLAGGAYMHWSPGQIHKWAGIFTDNPHRLKFAGEHMSYLHTGMEGAMESAENAVFSLLE